MQELLIVGDIAGQHDAFLRLVARVPETTFIMALGDLVDRGPKSKEVVDWFMLNGHRADSLQGNHEHMMLDWLDNKGVYEEGVWYSNGGMQTMMSFDPKNKFYVPSKYLDWLATRKRYKFFGDDPDQPELFVSHAALHPKMTVEEAAKADTWFDPWFMHSLLWNREEPGKAPYFQIMGHNSHWGLRKFDDWAMCIDTSRENILTGLQWPSRELLQEPY